MRRISRFLFLTPLMTFVMLGLLLPLSTYAASGSARSQTQVSDMKVYHSVSHANGESQNVTYHGGPIMPGTSVDYMIFWQPSGSKVPATYNSLIERYFHDIGQSRLYHNNTQYTDAQGQKPLSSSFGSAWVDRQAYPGKFITDKQLQQEVTHAMLVNGWTASLQHVFFVYTVKSEIICLDSSHKQCSNNVFCAYHSNFGNVIYAAMPDVLCGTPDSPNHDPQADNVIDSTSHEQNEAATDPLGNAWFNSSGAEIGDLCSTSYAPLAFQGGDIFLNGHPYTVQEEWDNAKSGCAIAGP